MEDKIKVIDLICQRHPSYGISKGWSEYTGGMKDDGQWFFRKMLDVPLEELVDFLNKLIYDERISRHELTDEEIVKSNIIMSQDGNWYNQLSKEKIEEFWRKAELDAFFGISIDPNKDKK